MPSSGFEATLKKVKVTLKSCIALDVYVHSVIAEKTWHQVSPELLAEENQG